MDKKEIWVDIPDYEGLYKVSNFGNVTSVKRNILLKKRLSFGYVLCKNGKSKDYLAHRLVLKSFFGDSNLDVNHIDGVKNNNNLDNLEYCTKSENILHAIKIGLIKKQLGENHSHNKLNNMQVSLIRKLSNKYKIKGRTLSTLFRISTGMVSLIINNKNWSHI
jgi:hypothetical protein